MAKLQTGGGRSFMNKVAHSMMCMKTHEVYGELVKSGVTSFAMFVEMSVAMCARWTQW